MFYVAVVMLRYLPHPPIAWDYLARLVYRTIGGSVILEPLYQFRPYVPYRCFGAGPGASRSPDMHMVS